MVCIQLLSRGHSDELCCFCYKYTTWLMSGLINRLLGMAPISAWYNHNIIFYTIPFTDLVIWRCKIYIINSKKENKALDPCTNTYPCAFPPSIYPLLLPQSVDGFFMGYYNSTKVVIYFYPNNHCIKRTFPLLN